MSKFYAVKVGRIPGIYLNWSECLKQVNGFSSAVFKAFKRMEDAELFIGEQKIIHNINQLDIYTDGSAQNEYLGFGAFCSFNNVQFELSGECDQDLLQTYDIQKQDCSNPTAEFIAVVEVLKKITQFKHRFPKEMTVLFHCDYQGVSNWICGNWKAKEDHIIKILKVAKECISQMPCNIEFKYVPAHSGVYGNERADKLAGSRLKIDEFDNLFENVCNTFT